MSSTYLVLRKSGYSFLFRSIIPKDLQPQLGSRQFQLSLKCGIRHQAKSLALHRYNLTQQIYASIRQSPAEKQLTPQQIKDRLKLELEHLKLDDQAVIAKHKPIEKETQSTSLQQQTHTGISLALLSSMPSLLGIRVIGGLLSLIGKSTIYHYLGVKVLRLK